MMPHEHKYIKNDTKYISLISQMRFIFPAHKDCNLNTCP